MKEIHFYTNLCNEVQVSDEELAEMLTDFVSTRDAIDDSIIMVVRTTQLSFLRNSWDYIDKGYKVFIHNSDWAAEVKEHMNIPNVEKDIMRGQDISKLLIGGTFGELC